MSLLFEAKAPVSCPACNGELSFDRSVNKFRCVGCGKLYTVEFPSGDFRNVVLREWKEMELPSEEWQAEWRKKYKRPFYYELEK